MNSAAIGGELCDEIGGVRLGVRLGVLISAGGRSAMNIHDACMSGELGDARIAIVIAHREEIEGVARCRAAGLRVAVLAQGDAQADALDDRIDAALAAAKVDLVCLAGYLRHFRVGERWRGRTLNIHPGLLPDFGGPGMFGLHVHRAVLAAGSSQSGCTVHEVDEQYDHGAVILQRKCPVLANDTAQSLAERVFKEECVAYPQAIRQVLAAVRAGVKA